MCQYKLAHALLCVRTHRNCDNIVDIASPEDDARRGVRGLELNAEASPHGIVGHGTNGRQDEGHLHTPGKTLTKTC